jgi:hypothetical protein
VVDAMQARPIRLACILAEVEDDEAAPGAFDSAA